MTGATVGPVNGFSIKDSGARQEFAGGMVRDTQDGKVDYLSMRLGPMFRRWATHLTKGRAKYPDVSVGVPNWTLAAGQEEYDRAKASAARHFEAWLAGESDEDHAAGVFFNINLAEYVSLKLDTGPPILSKRRAWEYEAHPPIGIHAQRISQRAMGRTEACCGDPSDCGELCDGGV